jgi:hypothetical protein
MTRTGTAALGWRLTAVLLAVAVSLLLAIPAAAATDGVISGKVANKTSGAVVVPGIELTLHVFQGGVEQSQARTTTDNDGAYAFSGLDTAADYSYGISLTYQDADYASPELSFQTGATLSQDIDVFDATDSSADIKISQSHTVVRTQASDIEVLEVYLVENTGVHTYVGSQVVPTLNRKETLRFSVLPGATSIIPQTGLMEQYLSIEQGDLVDTMAVPPGTRQVAFSYAVPWQGGMLFQKTFVFPTDYFNLLVENSGLKVAAPGMTQADTVDIGGVSYLRYDITGIAAGGIVSFTVSAVVTGGIAARFQWGLAGVLALALAGGVVYSLRRRPAPARVRAEPREQILLAIARLDEDFEARKVPEARYRRVRAELMARLTGSR